MLFKRPVAFFLLTLGFTALPFTQSKAESLSREERLEATCYKATEFVCAVERQITKGTNYKRYGQTPLAHDERLSYVARLWSEKQAQMGQLNHAGFPHDRQRQFQAEFNNFKQGFILAENVAYVSAAFEDVDSVANQLVENWYNSDGHRQNMLGNYNIMGVGVYFSGNQVYATQIFGRR